MNALTIALTVITTFRGLYPAGHGLQPQPGLEPDDLQRVVDARTRCGS